MSSVINLHPGAEMTRHMKDILAAKFPGVKFSVRASRGTAYGWYSVDWTDGPLSADVDEVLSCMVYSQFNSIDDSMRPTGRGPYLWNGKLYMPSAKSINTQRRLSEVYARRVANSVHARYGNATKPTGSFTKGDWYNQPVFANDSFGQYRDEDSWQHVVYSASGGQCRLLEEA